MDKSIETYIHQIVSGLTCEEKEKREIVDEMKDHLYLLKNEYLEQGLSEEAAVQKSLESFGEQEQLKNGYQESLFPYYRLFKIGARILFGLYAFIVLFKLLFQRIIVRILDYNRLNDPEFNRYFFYPPDSNEFFDLNVWKINTNIVPFQSTMNYINGSYHTDLDVILNNTLGNILIFLPLGIFLPILFKNFRTLTQVFVASILISSIIEILQFVSQLGQFDIDDIILNSSGSIIGFMFVKAVYILTKYTKINPFQKKIN